MGCHSDKGEVGALTEGGWKALFGAESLSDDNSTLDKIS